jgi:predicted small secreted protein
MLKKSHVPVAMLAAAFAVIGLSACNTVSGVGKDMQAVGRTVTGAAEDAKHNAHHTNTQRASTASSSHASGPR